MTSRLAGTPDDIEIGIIGVSKKYGGFTALSAIDLHIQRGEFLTLLGPSGSGKTTLLMILGGFQAPTEGKLMAEGADITALPAEMRQYGMVFQGYALFPHMTAAQNIAFPLQVRRRPRGEIRRRVADMIDRVGLRGHEHKHPANLSGGQQQRVALARALVFEPRVLLLDEPFSALDKGLREQMQVEVKRLHEQTGTTFVFVTHDQTEALALSSRIAIFDHGRLLQVGAANEVYDRPASRFVAAFLGEINLLPLTAVERDACGSTGLFEGQRLHVPGTAGSIAAIRPEHMALAEAPSDNTLEARVERRTYLGAATRLSLRTPGGHALTLTRPTHEVADGPGPGEAVRVCWPATRGFMLADGP